MSEQTQKADDMDLLIKSLQELRDVVASVSQTFESWYDELQDTPEEW